MAHGVNIVLSVLTTSEFYFSSYNIHEDRYTRDDIMILRLYAKAFYMKQLILDSSGPRFDPNNKFGGIFV